MDKAIEKINNRILELEKSIGELKLTISSLNKEIEDLKNGSFGTGVCYDGCPDYVTSYIKKSKKEGE